MNEASYEKLNFGHKINVIQKEHYPSNFHLHWHKAVEIICVAEDVELSEPVVLKVGGEKYELEAGDVLFVWQGELHEIVSNFDNVLTGIQFSTGILQELEDFAPYSNLLKTFHKFSYKDEPELVQMMRIYIEQIIQLEYEKKRFYHVEKLINMLELFMCITDYAHNNYWETYSQNTQRTEENFKKMQEACVYISENYEKDISLDEVASFIGFSSNYFSKVFKQTTGYNYVEFLLLERVKAAQSLLEDYTIPITEVSYRAGFKSISTFNRVFRNYKGCSPSEFRKYFL